MATAPSYVQNLFRPYVFKSTTATEQSSHDSHLGEQIITEQKSS